MSSQKLWFSWGASSWKFGTWLYLSIQKSTRKYVLPHGTVSETNSGEKVSQTSNCSTAWRNFPTGRKKSECHAGETSKGIQPFVAVDQGEPAGPGTVRRRSSGRQRRHRSADQVQPVDRRPLEHGEPASHRRHRPYQVRHHWRQGTRDKKKAQCGCLRKIYVKGKFASKPSICSGTFFSKWILSPRYMEIYAHIPWQSALVIWFYVRLKVRKRDFLQKIMFHMTLSARWEQPSLWHTQRDSQSCSWEPDRRTRTCATSTAAQSSTHCSSEPRDRPRDACAEIYAREQWSSAPRLKRTHYTHHTDFPCNPKCVYSFFTIRAPLWTENQCFVLEFVSFWIYTDVTRFHLDNCGINSTSLLKKK